MHTVAYSPTRATGIHVVRVVRDYTLHAGTSDHILQDPHVGRDVWHRVVRIASCTYWHTGQQDPLKEFPLLCALHTSHAVECGDGGMSARLSLDAWRQDDARQCQALYLLYLLHGMTCMAPHHAL